MIEFLAIVLVGAFAVAWLERYGNTHNNALSKTLDAILWWPLSIAFVLAIIGMVALALWFLMLPIASALQ